MNSNVLSGKKCSNFLLFYDSVKSPWISFSSRDKVSQILAADFMPKSSGLELFRMHDSVQRLRSKSTPHSLQLLLHKTISTAVNFLSFRHSHSSVNEIGPVLNEDLYGPEEIFGLITNLIITPSTKLEPAFQPRWTHYTATVPYETTLLNLKVVLNGLAAYSLFESERYAPNSQ